MYYVDLLVFYLQLGKCDRRLFCYTPDIQGLEITILRPVVYFYPLIHARPGRVFMGMDLGISIEVARLQW